MYAISTFSISQLLSQPMTGIFMIPPMTGIFVYQTIILFNHFLGYVCVKVASKCSVPPLDHLARYFCIVTLLCYTSS